jgi:NAD(P)H dehydrogenase (quinone)
MSDGNLNRLGSNSGLMAQVGSTSPAADIPQGDLDTARAYGERLRLLAQRMSA